VASAGKDRRSFAADREELDGGDGHASAGVLVLLAYLALSLVIGALLAYPAYVTLASAASVEFDSVLRRVIILTALFLLPLYLASTGSRDRSALGFSFSRKTFARDFSAGFGLGAAAVAPLVAAFVMLGIRAPTVPAMPTDVALYVVTMLLAAAVLGVFEEAYFRGALLSGLRRLPPSVAVAVVSVIYAAAHFVGGPVAAEEISWSSGLISIGRSDLRLDAFLALLAAGFLLGAMRVRFGHVAVSAGFHSAWVWLMQINREYSDVDSSSPLAFLQGSYGGTMGYLGLAWIALIGAIWFICGRRRGA
jgi:membrane protease YdiL (CAAX protease family)